MNAALMIAISMLVLFAAILVTLALTRSPSEPDTVTQAVVRQGLTGPVPLPPRHARLDAPNSQAAEAGDEAT